MNIFFDKLRDIKVKSRFISILFKVRLLNGSIRSCSTAQIHDLKNGSLESLYNHLEFIFRSQDIAAAISDEPSPDYIFGGQIIFTFKFLSPNITKSKYENVFQLRARKENQVFEGRKLLTFFKFKEFKLPSKFGVEY